MLRLAKMPIPCRAAANRPIGWSPHPLRPLPIPPLISHRIDLPNQGRVLHPPQRGEQPRPHGDGAKQRGATDRDRCPGAEPLRGDAGAELPDLRCRRLVIEQPSIRT